MILKWSKVGENQRKLTFVTKSEIDFARKLLCEISTGCNMRTANRCAPIVLSLLSDADTCSFAMDQLLIRKVIAFDWWLVVRAVP